MRGGRLPWDVPKPKEIKIDHKDPNAFLHQEQNKREKAAWEREVLQRKENTSIDQMCGNCPIQFKQYMKYCRDLTFDQKPNYRYLRNLFEALFREMDFVDDGNYDWITHKLAILAKRE